VADGTWNLAEAKAKFSEVVEKALREGPQHVSRNGRPAVVIVPEADWATAQGRGKSFVEALFDPSIRGLLTAEEVDTLFKRDPDVGRPIKF
jgi:prevent-host-death family protein